MKTEYEFGQEYAEWMKGQGQTGTVNVDEMCGQSVDIPEGDYQAMVDAGIDNPDPREYWRGYNDGMGE